MKECDLESLGKFFSGIFVVVMGFINPTGSYLMALVLAFGFNILAGLRADEGKTLIRIHDGYDMGKGIQLGVDTSTGEPREDKLEYYREEIINL